MQIFGALRSSQRVEIGHLWAAISKHYPGMNSAICCILNNKPQNTELGLDKIVEIIYTSVNMKYI
jgi:hypothetical protein